MTKEKAFSDDNCPCAYCNPSPELSERIRIERQRDSDRRAGEYDEDKANNRDYERDGRDAVRGQM